MLRRKVVLDDQPEASEENVAFIQPRMMQKNDSIGRMHLHLFSIVKRLAVCSGGCALCCLVFLLIIVLVVNEGHHVTCRLHGALCTPFREYVNRFPMLPQRRKDRLSLAAPIPYSCERFEDFLTRHHEDRSHPSNPKQRLLFLIGESRGGSTYTYDTLNFHPEIQMVGGEALFGFSNNVCNNNKLLLRNHEDCTFTNWLEALYENAYSKARSSRPPLVGTKINVGQIPPEFFEDFASYLACIRESAVVLHVTRASGIASFLNYQSEVPERIYSANYDFDSSNNVAKGLETPLELDPELAADWVHTRDGLSQDLFTTLAFNAPRPLRYQRVYYEHLKDPVVGEDYWRSVFAFLGVDSSVSVTTLRAQSPQNNGKLRTQNKTHGSTPCSHRIANWEQVKEALGPDSLSSIVCENHSR